MPIEDLVNLWVTPVLLVEILSFVASTINPLLILFVVDGEHDWFLELVDVVRVVVYIFRAFHAPAWMLRVMTVFRSFFADYLTDRATTF